MSSCHVSREYRSDDIIDLFYGYVNKHVFKRSFEFWFKAEKKPTVYFNRFVDPSIYSDLIKYKLLLLLIVALSDAVKVIHMHLYKMVL